MVALGLSIISPERDVLQVSIHLAYFSDLQNGAIMFACLAEELRQANSAVSDLQTFLKPLGGRCSVTCAMFVPVLNTASTYTWVASIDGAFCVLCSDKCQFPFIGAGCWYCL